VFGAIKDGATLEDFPRKLSSTVMSSKVPRNLSIDRSTWEDVPLGIPALIWKVEGIVTVSSCNDNPENRIPEQEGKSVLGSDKWYSDGD
jgi:hypothetical protein